MSQFTYLGNNVGIIHTFYYGYGDNPQKIDELAVAHVKQTDNCIKGNRTRHLIAITANLYQKSSHDTLKQNGFRKVISFLSSHGNLNETLTLWVKKDIDAPIHAKGKEPAIGAFPGNCSVRWNNALICSYRPHNCHLCSSKPTDEGYKKILGSPIWFKIDKKFVVKTDR